jgi:hypothetical protein
MPALLAVVAVVALLVGAAVGWAVTVRGPARWCGRCGESLRCLTCSPVTAPGRAAVRWPVQPASTMDGEIRQRRLI